jgi:methionyl-tRNA synthetase
MSKDISFTHTLIIIIFKKMTINFDEFKKVELKVVRVLEAEKVEGSEKLLKLRVDLGSEQRQIIAGIGKAYAPENLIDREIVIVANLEPRTLMGLESQGMVLAASGEDGPVLLSPEKDVPPGALVG